MSSDTTPGDGIERREARSEDADLDPPGDRSPTGTEKRVGWAELFFDLVYVVAVTQVSTVVEEDHTALGLLRAVLVFVPLYWLWVGAAVRTNQRDTERLPVRLALFAVALAAVFMAAAVPEAYGELAPVFAVAYWVGRIVLGVDLLLSTGRHRGTVGSPLVVSMLLTGPVLVVGALVGGTGQLILWGLAALVDLSAPRVLRGRMRGMYLAPAHLAERFGLFVLIALGESVAIIGASTGRHFGLASGVALVTSFVLACGLWWVYFHFAHAAVRHALDSAAVQADITRLVLSYGHLLFVAAVVALSVGLEEAIAHPTEVLGWGGAGMLVGGTALFLAGFGFTRWAMFGLVSRTRLGAAAVVLLVLPVAALSPALIALVATAAIVAVLNVVELRINDREGWRAHGR